MADELEHVFITMQASNGTTMFNWARNVEEIRSVLSRRIPEQSWPTLRVYGPSMDDFDSRPAVCFEFVASAADMGFILTDIEDEVLWLDAAVKVHVVRGPVNQN